MGLPWVNLHFHGVYYSATFSPTALDDDNCVMNLLPITVALYWKEKTLQSYLLQSPSEQNENLLLPDYSKILYSVSSSENDALRCKTYHG